MTQLQEICGKAVNTDTISIMDTTATN